MNLLKHESIMIRFFALLGKLPIVKAMRYNCNKSWKCATNVLFKIKLIILIFCQVWSPPRPPRRTATTCARRARWTYRRRRSVFDLWSLEYSLMSFCWDLPQTKVRGDWSLIFNLCYATREIIIVRVESGKNWLKCNCEPSYPGSDTENGRVASWISGV